jgi:hypothetical protein
MNSSNNVTIYSNAEKGLAKLFVFRKNSPSICEVTHLFRNKCHTIREVTAGLQRGQFQIHQQSHIKESNGSAANVIAKQIMATEQHVLNAIHQEIQLLYLKIHLRLHPVLPKLQNVIG